MAERVCPWWVGHLLASPVRRLYQNPELILGPWVKPGMTVLEPGSGMGYFTLPIARMVGAQGRVICVDLQQKMLEGLIRRAERAGLSERVEARLCRTASLGVEDLAGRIDFALAFAMVHEVPDRATLFAELASALRPGGRLLVAEPAGHVDEVAFAETLDIARHSGLEPAGAPEIRGSLTAILKRAA
ncbi:SAM-dependent methyltransferase [Salinispira pacifica]